MIGVVSGKIHEHADSPHLLALLRERRRRPGSHRAAEERNKFAASKASAHLPVRGKPKPRIPKAWSSPSGCFCY